MIIYVIKEALTSSFWHVYLVGCYLKLVRPKLDEIVS